MSKYQELLKQIGIDSIGTDSMSQVNHTLQGHIEVKTEQLERLELMYARLYRDYIALTIRTENCDRCGESNRQYDWICRECYEALITGSWKE